MGVVVLLDVSSLIYRAFYSGKAHANRLCRSDGLATNAVYGVAMMLNQLKRDITKEIGNIDCFIGCGDSSSCNKYRKNIDSEYKSHRKPCPDGLSHQFSWIRQLFHVLKIPFIDHDSYEADDIIATFVEKFKNDNTVVIVSPDKDICQLVGPSVCVYNAKKKSFLWKEQVSEVYGVAPEHICIYLSLIGDTADNIKGVPSVGPKTAAKIIKDCNGDIYNYNGPKKDLIQNNIAIIEKGLSLTKLQIIEGINVESSDLGVSEPDEDGLRDFLVVMEFDVQRFIKMFCNSKDAR